MFQRTTQIAFNMRLALATRDKPLQHAASVDPVYNADEYWIDKGHNTGFAVDNSEVLGIHSQFNGRMKNIMEMVDAVQRMRGLKIITLSCYDWLEPLYAKHGWKVSSYVPFCAELARSRMGSLVKDQPHLAPKQVVWMHKYL